MHYVTVRMAELSVLSQCSTWKFRTITGITLSLLVVDCAFLPSWFDSTILTVNQQNNNSVDFRYYWVYALYHKSCVKNKK